MSEKGERNNPQSSLVLCHGNRYKKRKQRKNACVGHQVFQSPTPHRLLALSHGFFVVFFSIRLHSLGQACLFGVQLQPSTYKCDLKGNRGVAGQAVTSWPVRANLYLPVEKSRGNTPIQMFGHTFLVTVPSANLWYFLGKMLAGRKPITPSTFPGPTLLATTIHHPGMYQVLCSFTAILSEACLTKCIKGVKLCIASNSEPIQCALGNSLFVFRWTSRQHETS